MSPSRQAHSRRTILRAAGICMALPILDSSIGPDLQAHEPKKHAAGPKARMICIANPLGPANEYWHPKDTGPSYTMTPTLQALADWRQYLTVLSGPCHIRMPAGGGHESTARLLTSLIGNEKTKSPVTRISMDQIAATHLGDSTRFPSLQISCEEGVGPIGVSRTISFNHAGRPLPSIKDPRTLFKMLFVAEGKKSAAMADQRFQERSSLLDGIRDQLGHLNKSLGSNDRRRIEHFQDSVREVEKQLQRDKNWSKVAKPQVDAAELQFEPKSRIDWINTINAIVCLALQTDSSRVINMLYGVERDTYRWSEVGADVHHAMQHHNGKEQTLKKLAKVDKAKLTCVAGLCKRLKDIDTPHGNLLDQTMIWYGHGLNNGGPNYQRGTGIHYTRDLSHLVLGGGTLGLKHGQHLQFDSKKVPLSNLWVTFLQGMGIDQKSFADSTGTIPGLT